MPFPTFLTVLFRTREAFPAEFMSARACNHTTDLTVNCNRSQASGEEQLTCHIKTTLIFLNEVRATRVRTQFRMGRDPLLRFLKFGITVFLLTLIFIASHALVPRDLMLETHLEAALFA